MSPTKNNLTATDTSSRAEDESPLSLEPKRIIVTIDGPAGVGKSTIAKRAAQGLGLAYLDTGAMFRTVALHLAKQSLLGTEEAFDAGAVNESAVRRVLDSCLFSLQGTGDATRLFCNDIFVGEEIRTEEAGMMASRAGQVPEVRKFLKQAQQRLGASFSLVAEGRDMGTVVFPGAGCKIFLDADVEVRAQRRFLQLRQTGVQADFVKLREDMRIRDEQDRNRSIAPLRPAEDALYLDTSYLDIDEVFDAVMRRAEAVYGHGRGCLPPSWNMRRKDRALSRKEALTLLEKGEYGVLASMEGGWPYAVPLSYVLMDGALYFHSAYTGRKVDAMKACDKVCFTVVGDTRPVYDKDFTTYYESVMAFGRVVLVEDAREKHKSLMALAEKYLPMHMDKAEGDISRSFSRTAVYRISLDLITGKAKRPKVC